MTFTSTADLYDEHGEDLAVCSVPFRSFGGRPRFAGVVTTVSCFEDNVLVRRVLGEPGGGRVLVVDGGGSVRAALMGDQIADLAVGRGWEGVVIHGAVRDSVALAGVDLGVKALGTVPRKSEKAGAGAVDVDVTFGDVTFRAGDRVVVDEDGVVVLP